MRRADAGLGVRPFCCPFCCPFGYPFRRGARAGGAASACPRWPFGPARFASRARACRRGAGGRLSTVNHRPPATGHRPPATGHRPPTTGHRPPATDHRPPTTGHRPPATDHRPPTTDHRPPATGHRPPTTDHRPPTTGSGGPPAPSHAVEWRAAVPLAGCRFYSTRARPRVRLDQAMSNQWPANVAGASMRPPSSPWDRYHVDFVLVNPYRSGESRRACR
ncbi:hypothetical protein X880_4455 [Burkholderia pseudomallei MSHR4032]|nr:hypothetical protein X880_4455 [Burkholderia pseudomallei MSHR4032]